MALLDQYVITTHQFIFVLHFVIPRGQFYYYSPYYVFDYLTRTTCPAVCYYADSYYNLCNLHRGSSLYNRPRPLRVLPEQPPLC